MSKKLLAINLSANLVSFLVSLAINFFLTPFIVKSVGAEAYGFVTLSNNFVSYISITAIALNSMVGRFVTIKTHQNELESANKYFSSVVIANGVLAFILLIPTVFIIIFINRIINVPNYLLYDVQISFALILLGFLFSLIFSVFSVSLFIKNKLYLSSLRNTEGVLINGVVLVALFSIFPAKIFFISLVSLIVQLYTVLWNFYYTKKLTPELKVKRRYFSMTAIKDLISSGVWNVVSKLSQILNEGLDLLITNLFIGAGPMGVLAIAKVIPSMIMSILGRISSVFSPDLTKFYAKHQFNEMVNLLNKSIKFLGIFVNVPIAGLIVYGDIFYKLWMPTQDAKQLQLLSILTIAGLIISGSTASIYDIFTVTNKVKLNSIVTLIQGILNTVIVLIIIKKTNLGIYAVAGVSTALSIIRNLVFTLPYASKCIKQKWYTLYFPAFKTTFSVLLVSIVCLVFRKLFVIDTWLQLIGFGLISGIIGIVVNAMFILSKNEKMNLLGKRVNKLKFNI